MKIVKTLVYIFVFLLLVVNLYMSFQIYSKMGEIRKAVAPKKSLPCESVPLNWAVTNYECANSLLLAMNVTNVKFEPPGTAHNLRVNSSRLTKREAS
jgi:hypothetical protein